ncbi:MAG: hypothetical protein HYY78_10040 [Betaproteobacteria bacterium]|nr:hypothetical protein [Betaproteobacteria bacterium]
MDYVIIAAIIVVALALLAWWRRGSGHPSFKPLDVGGRAERSAEEFHRDFYAGLGSESIQDIHAVLEAVSRATGLPAGKLEPADELGAIAAANGLQRAFLVAAKDGRMRISVNGKLFYEGACSAEG